MSAKVGTARHAARNGNGKAIDTDIAINPAIVVDISSWRMDEYMRWEELRSDGAAGSVEQLNELMATAVEAWPFDGDPRDPVSYRKSLFPYEWAEVVAAVANAQKAAFQRPHRRTDQGGEVSPARLSPSGPVSEGEQGQDDTLPQEGG
jgi:hypothetical protein